jgi:hypothetical protein
VRRFSPALVLAALALFVALAGTATAGAVKLITGAQIKNGTVGLVDISAGAKAALKGARGPAGTQGLPGAQGAPGPQGAPGLLTATKTYLAEGTIGAGAIEAFSASCPAGSGLVSGGVFSSGGPIFADHQSGNGWIIGVDNFDWSITTTWRIYLNCAAGLANAAASSTSSTASLQSEVQAYRAAKAAAS